MKGLIDFHCHLLPNIDDGSKSVHESVKLLELSAENGVVALVATPHFYTEEQKLDEFAEKRQESINLLKSELKGKTPKIFVGAEVTYFTGIGKSERLSNLCIKGTNVLLVEMPFSVWSASVVKDVVLIKEKLGIQPVLVHMERYGFIQPKSALKELAESGVLFQYSAGFFTEKGNFFKKRKAIRSGLINLLGSDFHNLSDRKPDLSQDIEKVLGEELLEGVNFLSEKLLVGATEI